MVWGIDHWTSVSTIQHILAFVVMRLVGVKYPHKMKKFTPRMAFLVTFIWFLTGTVGGLYPMLAMDLVPVIRRGVTILECQMSPDWYTFATYHAYYAATLLLLLPSILVVSLSIYVTVLMKKRLQNRKKNGRWSPIAARKEKMAMVQLVLVVGSFLFGYGPEIFFRIEVTLSLAFNWDYNTVFGVFHVIAICRFLSVRISECMNPLLYNIASSNMRSATIKFFSGFGLKFCQENPDETGQQMLIGNVNSPQPLPNVANVTGEQIQIDNVINHHPLQNITNNMREQIHMGNVINLQPLPNVVDETEEQMQMGDEDKLTAAL